MLYGAKAIHRACKGDLEDENHVNAVLDRLLPDPADRSSVGPRLLSMLRSLPDAEAQIKIMRTFTVLAKKYGCTITNFSWWDIADSQHCLNAVIAREGRTMLAQFFWRVARKGEQISFESCPSPLLFPDKASPCGYRLDVEAISYKRMIGSFERWLAAPLVCPDTAEASTVTPLPLHAHPDSYKRTG